MTHFDSNTAAWPTLLHDLAGMPDEAERAFALFPASRLTWKPQEWGGAPGETFSAIGHACHLRDIERDGYHVRFRRLLEETRPSLVSLDGYEIERERDYERASLAGALAAFREARAVTVSMLAGLGDSERARAGDFAEYGRLTLQALAHYLRSHDQQHLAGLQWLAGKMASQA